MQTTGIIVLVIVGLLIARALLRRNLDLFDTLDAAIHHSFSILRWTCLLYTSEAADG